MSKVLIGLLLFIHLIRWKMENLQNIWAWVKHTYLAWEQAACPRTGTCAWLLHRCFWPDPDTTGAPSLSGCPGASAWANQGSRGRDTENRWDTSSEQYTLRETARRTGRTPRRHMGLYYGSHHTFISWESDAESDLVPPELVFSFFLFCFFFFLLAPKSPPGLLNKTNRRTP